MIKILSLLLKTLGIILLTGILMALGYRIRYKWIVNARQKPMQHAQVPASPLLKQVNPFIGTGSFHLTTAYNYPGPSLPFGVLRLSPETASLFTNERGKSTSGYFYGDNKICGFSHTRLSGTGATDGGHFLVTPVKDQVNEKVYASGKFIRFSHRHETAFPGYYAVKLPGENVFVELTATERVGIHRYTFEKVKNPHILINVSNTIGNRKSSEGEARILPDKNEVEGSIRTFGTFAKRYGGIKVYFVARFNRKFMSTGTWTGKTFNPGQTKIKGDDIGVDIGFENRGDTTEIILKLAVSHVSIENARKNLETEAASLSFEDLLAVAQRKWKEKLSRIKISGATDKQRIIFYTALYRVFQMPTDFTDVNGEYTGFDKKVHKADGFRYFTDLSLWDTFRTLHPLFNLIAMDDQRDMMVSLVKMAEQGGWLPRWPSGYGYTGSMLGTPADITIADAWLKGIRGFDVEYAYQSMRKTALGPTPKGAGFPGRRGIESYLKYHYCAADEMDEAVSKTLEYSWADFAISQLAKSLGKENDAALFAEHSQYYKNTWNPETRYFQPRNADGRFAEFKPLLLTYLDRNDRYTDDYTEGSALQWRWAVPFDPQGLISLFESREYFVNELNDFFEKSHPRLAEINPRPYYWHGNEPDIHAAYLFNEAGRPDLTQKWVRWILNNKYSTTYEGLDGNDDSGTLSAWYIFSSLGFYPIAGSDIYQLGTPLFEKIELNMNGKQLIIRAKNYSPDHFYVKKVFLNGTLLHRTWIKHAEIAEGGLLEFEMASGPGNE